MDNDSMEFPCRVLFAQRHHPATKKVVRVETLQKEICSTAPDCGLGIYMTPPLESDHRSSLLVTLNPGVSQAYNIMA